MQPRSTLFAVVEAHLNDQGTSFGVLVPDLLDEGMSFHDVTYEIRQRTNVPIHEATVRRWLKAVAA